MTTSRSTTQRTGQPVTPEIDPTKLALWMTGARERNTEVLPGGRLIRDEATLAQVVDELGCTREAWITLGGGVLQVYCAVPTSETVNTFYAYVAAVREITHFRVLCFTSMRDLTEFLNQWLPL